jgi:hypothetical protein
MTTSKLSEFMGLLKTEPARSADTPAVAILKAQYVRNRMDAMKWMATAIGFAVKSIDPRQHVQRGNRRSIE